MENRCIYNIDSLGSVPRVDIIANSHISDEIYAGPSTKAGASIEIEKINSCSRILLQLENSDGGSLSFRLPSQTFSVNRSVAMHFRGTSNRRIVVVPGIYSLRDGVMTSYVKMRGMVVDGKVWSYSEAAHLTDPVDPTAEYFLDLAFPGQNIVLDVEAFSIW